MPIKGIPANLSAYDHVTLCAPIRVFVPAAPMRRFCTQAAGHIKEADYILVHHQNGAYKNAAEEMDRLLGINHTKLCSLRCRKGAYKVVCTYTREEERHESPV